MTTHPDWMQDRDKDLLRRLEADHAAGTITDDDYQATLTDIYANAKPETPQRSGNGLAGALSVLGFVLILLGVASFIKEGVGFGLPPILWLALGFVAIAAGRAYVNRK